MKLINRRGQIRQTPPPTLAILHTNVTNTSRILLMTILVKHINKIPRANAFQSREPVSIILILAINQQAKQQRLRHNGDLAELHGTLLDSPEVKGEAAIRITHSAEDKGVVTGVEEGEEEAGGSKRLNVAPRVSIQGKGGDEARGDIEDVEAAFAEGRA